MLGKAGFGVTETNRVSPQTALIVILGGNIALWAGLFAFARWLAE